MIGRMTRWGPDARGRLMKSALELYGKRGYDQTTVADIAERAGLTERTFFRHFADKKEVLFAGSNDLRDLLVSAVAGAPSSAARAGCRSRRAAARRRARLAALRALFRTKPNRLSRIRSL